MELSNCQAHSIQISIPENYMGSPKESLEEKNIFAENYDEIRRLDGTSYCHKSGQSFLLTSVSGQLGIFGSYSIPCKLQVQSLPHRTGVNKHTLCWIWLHPLPSMIANLDKASNCHKEDPVFITKQRTLPSTKQLFAEFFLMLLIKKHFDTAK